MADDAARSIIPLPTADAGPSLAERLERGEIIVYPVCPFALPEGDDRQFLLEQRLGTGHKNISFDPHTQRLTGLRRRNEIQAERFRELLASFSSGATSWLANTLPNYARAWRLDLASFRSEEEATRRLRLHARNDLLHVDAFPSRPTNGARILRLFVNVNPVDARVWVTSDPFPRLLHQLGRYVGLPASPRRRLAWRWENHLVRLFHPRRPRRSFYDAFMLRFHNFLKSNDYFQERCPKHYWTFPPGSAWLLFSDYVCHAALRGRYALEHSYFVPRDALFLPDEAPATILENTCGFPVLNQAA